MSMTMESIFRLNSTDINGMAIYKNRKKRFYYLQNVDANDL